LGFGKVNCDKIESVMLVKEAKFRNKNNRLIMTRLTTVEEQGNRSFDVEFWQSLSDEQRLASVWEMVVFDWELRGKNPDELRLQRFIANLRQQEG
jgi:hypothetical protein